MVLKPKISIVTVSYNDAENLEITLKKSIAQTYPNKEIIVIDGGSNDNSKEIIKVYKSDLAYSISEPDNGIYDAMNKGIQVAKGEWVIFMNSGDWFFDDNVLKEIFENDIPGNPNFIYGNHEVRYANGLRRTHVASKPLEYLKKNNVFSHQALFSKTSVLRAHPYEIKYSMVADFESFFYHYKTGHEFLFMNKKISSITAGGVSEVRGYTSCNQRKNIVFQYESGILLSLYYTFFQVRLFLGKIAKSILPEWAIKLILKVKYSF